MNKDDLITAFRSIGLREGMTLEVHSSLSSFGQVEGGAQSVIDALISCVGQAGSIFMPALRLSRDMELTEEDRRLGITRKLKILPPDAERTGMGIIADTFRRRADTVTGEGIFRTCGWGLQAGQALSGGLDYAIHHGGKALMLGVDIYRLTAMHYMEDMLPADISARFAPGAEALEKYPPDEWHIESWEPPCKPWYTIQEKAIRLGLINQGAIGDCRYMFFDILPVVSLYREALQKDPYALYGLVKA